MSRLPVGSVFSAAHASRWEGLPVDTLRADHAMQSRLGFERTNGHCEDADYDVCTPSEWSDSSGSDVSSTREREFAVRVACSTKSREMAVKTYTWITLWFLLTAPVVLWDASYCFMRPRSMVGGDLHWIWEPYGLYQNIDYVYGLKALEENNGFTNAQSLLNVVETAMNLAYVYLAHVSSWPGAPLVGFAAATMTLSKTVLYWLQEYYCGGCATWHNDWNTYLIYWVTPNGFWLVFPTMIVWRLGADIARSLSAASQGDRKVASGKMQ